jgi:multiple sugar transport system permease protein
LPRSTERFLPYALLSPILIVILALGLYPFLYVIWLSFQTQTASTTPIFVGLENFYEIIFRDQTFRDVFGNTLVYVVSVVTAEFLIGLGLALLLNREFKGKRIIAPLIYLPMMVTPVAVGLTFRIMYNVEYGPFTYFLDLLGLPAIPWIASATYALFSLIVVDIWEWTPFMFLVLLAGLQIVPRECVEASQLDGASYWQRFRHITLPFLRSSIAVALLIRMIDAFKAFDIIYTVTEGGPGTSSAVLSFFTYIVGFRWFSLGYAAAMSLILFFLILIPTQLLFRRLRRKP